VNAKAFTAHLFAEELVMVQQHAASAKAMNDQSKALWPWPWSWPLAVPKTELVVAACTEDVSWVDSAAKQYKFVTVYDKCWDLRKAELQRFKATNLIVQRLENIGSCDFAFLTYILDRWDSLPDIVEFTKGSPSTSNYKSHGLAPLQCMQCDGKCNRFRTDNVRYNVVKPLRIRLEKLVKKGFKDFGLQMNFYLKHHKFVNNDVKMEFHRSGYANMGHWMKNASTVSPLSQRVYEDACCARSYGGHFTATRKQIVNEAYFQGKSRELYAWLRDQQHYANEEVDHFIERTWWSVFCAAHHSI